MNFGVDKGGVKEDRKRTITRLKKSVPRTWTEWTCTVRGRGVEVKWTCEWPSSVGEVEK